MSSSFRPIGLQITSYLKDTNRKQTNKKCQKIENPKDTIRKLLELLSEFSNVAGYKISIQKSLAFLYINNEKSKEKLRNQSHLPLQQKEENI